MRSKFALFMALMWMLATIINVITYSEQEISLHVIYEEAPIESVLAYYDTGNGYNENEKIIARRINEKEYAFDFNVNINAIRQIRFDLSYHCQRAVLKSLDWRRNGNIVSEISYDVLSDYTINMEQVQLKKKGDAIVASTEYDFICLIFDRAFLKLGSTPLLNRFLKVIEGEAIFFAGVGIFICIIYVMRIRLLIREKKKTGVYLSFFTLFSGNFIIRNGINIEFLFQKKTQSDIVAFLIACLLAFYYAVLYYGCLDLRGEADTLVRTEKRICMRHICEDTFFVLLWWGLYEILLCRLVNGYAISEIVNFFVNYVMTPRYLLNLLLLFLCYGFLQGIAGRGLGNVLWGLLSVILIVGNAIKIKFHQSLLTPMDFLQIKDMLRISKAFINIRKMGVIVCIIVLLSIAVIIRFRKQVCSYLKPKASILKILVYGILLTSLTYLLATEKLSDMGYMYMAYANEFVNESENGIYVYNLNNILRLKEVYISKPPNYTEENMQNLKQEFQSIAAEEEKANDDKPNVILVMAESLFDLECIDDVTFSKEVEPTIHTYQTSSMISPRYGGYTAAVEFEALTGMSLAFLPEGLMPYTTYFHNAQETMPSIAWEFKKNGYETVAIHPNLKEFYNRDVAYQELGFEQFLAIDAFEVTDESITMAGYIRDAEVAKKIIEQLESAEMPTFTFAVTIEGHYMTAQKYEVHEIEAESSMLSEAQLWELEETAESYKNTDEMIKTLIDYVNQTDKSTILYVFGDHLPPLTSFDKLQYTGDVYNKYSTVLLAYSNYKDIEFKWEYITPNQLAAQIVSDADIEHSSYFDYIAAFGEEYPILQKQFVDTEDSVERKK